MNLPGGIWSTRDASDLVSDTEDSEHSLQRSISSVGLTAMGVGAIIGTGIFVVSARAPGDAGPAVILSFVLAAVTCLFSALSYAELAVVDPGLRQRLHLRLRHAGRARRLDHRLGPDPRVRRLGGRRGRRLGRQPQRVPRLGLRGRASRTRSRPSPEDGGVFNLPAVFIVLAITFLLIRGTRESARANLSWSASSSRSWCSSSSSPLTVVQHRQLQAVRAARRRRHHHRGRR